MLKRFLVSVALAGSALVAPVAALPASASVQTHAATATASCTYQRSGDHWNCITPGAFCPAAAHGKYGYAKVTNKRYRCLQDSGGSRWRWKPVR
ncbi:hypothetical protein [Streptosporangium sp. NPDC051022]|uniref:hypothetical protein n=1 Tax=Streptosporangium sp. NPDC051022 TaxID=3155752 RepID=UPI00341C0C47